MVLPGSGRPQILDPLARVTEAIEDDAHAVHVGEVEAAGAAVVVALIEVIEVAAGIEGASGAAGEEDGELVCAVGVSVEEVGAHHEQ